MIVGIGTDLIEIQRIKRACEKEAFFIRCFTNAERELIKNDYVRAAGNFAAKEAVSKAFGTGFRGFSLLDIEILRDELGKPYVNLYNGAYKLSKDKKINTIHLSITNTLDFAQAFAVGESL